jgi:hypothetical protein
MNLPRCLGFCDFAHVQVFRKKFNHGNRRLYAILHLAETVAFIGEEVYSTGSPPSCR